MKLLLTALSLVVTSAAFPQKHNVYFFKNDGRQVALRDSADYIRIVAEPDSGSALYNVTEFYRANSGKKLIGTSSTIDPVRFQGQCVEFFTNGNKKALHNYKDNFFVDQEYLYFPNGKLYQIRVHPHSNPGIVPGDSFGITYTIQSCLDSSGTELVTDGKGYYKGYDDEFKHMNEEGPVVNGRQDGTWKGYQAGNIFTEMYINGELQKGIATAKDGAMYTYNGHRGIPPSYPGGFDAFYQYVGQNVVYPENARRNSVQGKVLVSFVIEKNGKVSDAKILRSVSPELDEEALRVVRNSPKWIPGTMFGQKVRVQYSIPLAFALK